MRPCGSKIRRLTTRKKSVLKFCATWSKCPVISDNVLSHLWANNVRMTLHSCCSKVMLLDPFCEKQPSTENYLEKAHYLGGQSWQCLMVTTCCSVWPGTSWWACAGSRRTARSWPPATPATTPTNTGPPGSSSSSSNQASTHRQHSTCDTWLTLPLNLHLPNPIYPYTLHLWHVMVMVSSSPHLVSSAIIKYEIYLNNATFS